MKKFLLILFLSLPIQKIQSQIVFCPPGAEWHYVEYSLKTNGYDYANVVVKYVRDSIIGAETVKVLRQDDFFTRCNFTSGNRLSVLRQKGDTVFIRNITTNHTWQVFYNFAATAGQSWTMTINAMSNPGILKTYTIDVNAVNSSTINGFVLKDIYLTCRMTSAISFTAQATERFGTRDMFMCYYLNPDPSCSGATDGISAFLCYQDNAFGLKQFTAFPCDYSNPVGIGKNNYQNFDVKIYPNPANDIFSINTGDELINRNIFASIQDIYGREIKQVTLNNINSESNKVDIADLANGIYILSLKNEGLEIYKGKLVKAE